jgi:hypothetical protein
LSQIKYVSVVELESGDRQIRLGKQDESGSEVIIPTPNNGIESMQQREWERVGVFTLPEPMAKSGFKDWWNEHKDDEPQPSPIPEVLAAMDAEATDV